MDYKDRLESDVKSDIMVLLTGAERALSEALDIITNARSTYENN